MKTFSQFLAESVRNYIYNVKLSFKPDNETMTKIEQALAKYNVVSITAPRSLPIQRVDKDFPGINSPETYVFTVEVAYPAPAEFVRHTIANMGFAMETVAVSSVEHDASMEKEEEGIGKNSDGALLTKAYDGQDNKKISAENYGGDYNEKLVKNSIGSTDQVIPKEFKKTKGKTLNDIPTGDKSAMGSTKNKIPSVKSFAR